MHKFNDDDGRRNMTENPIFSPCEQIIIRNASDAYQIFKSFWDVDLMGFLEEFKMMMLDRDGKVSAVHDLLLLGLTAQFTDIQAIMDTALKVGAHAIILAHNRPSGAVQPGKEERMLTARIVSMAKQNGIVVKDHLIITRDSYFSYSEHGLIL